MPAPASANKLPNQTPNTSSPIGKVEYVLNGELTDGLGKPVTGTLSFSVPITQPWRYLFGTFVQRDASVDPMFSLTAGASYSQVLLQQLIDQVEALSAAVGTTQGGQ